MPPYNKRTIRAYIQDGDRADCTTGPGREAKGRALERLVRYLFNKINSVRSISSNIVDLQNSQEIDLAVVHSGPDDPLDTFFEVILIECKNWNSAVGAPEVTVFDRKLETRSLNFGLLFAANGITGDADARTAAVDTIAYALGRGRRIVVITLDDIRNIGSTEEFVSLIRERFTDLYLYRGLKPI